jgi:hypothetical protein
VKINAQYGNLLAHLLSHAMLVSVGHLKKLIFLQVKARFTRYRREIRDHAKSEARAIYQLETGLGQGKRVDDLLLNDTFVYGVDERVRWTILFAPTTLIFSLGKCHQLRAI